MRSQLYYAHHTVQRHKWIHVLLVAWGLVAAQTSQANPLQVGRYSELYPALTTGQRDLLADTQRVQIPDTIATVGQAIEHLLQHSGYRLADPKQISADAQAMLSLPLPGSHRRFEGVPLQDVLQTLVGPAYTLVHDPVHRLISFERCRSPRVEERR